MEWRAGTGPNAQSVIVPDEFVVAILLLLQQSGVTIDPYRDQTLGKENTQRILEVLKTIRDLKRVEVEDEVKLELGILELPVWAEKMVAARMEQDTLTKICAALIGLCEYALSQGIDIEVLGQ